MHIPTYKKRNVKEIEVGRREVGWSGRNNLGRLFELCKIIRLFAASDELLAIIVVGWLVVVDGLLLAQPVSLVSLCCKQSVAYSSSN